MRIVPQNFVLHGRIGLRALGLIAVATVCGTCAKFPPNANANFTAITFTFQVAGQINITAPFVYDVAFSTYTSTNGDQPPVIYAPLPVINSSNPNGRVAGSPNFFVEYTTPGGLQPYTLYQFALSSQVPNPNDPTNPVNIGVWAPSNNGVISQYTDPSIQGNDPTTISFTVYTNQLTSTAAEANALTFLQVNILTMTRIANQGSGNRIIDALGDSDTANGLTQFQVVDLRHSGTYNNGTTGIYEPTGDTYPPGSTEPDVDIINYSITVTKP